VRVRFTPEALLAIREKRAWWQEHRKDAPRMFADELGVIVRKLRDGTAAERQKYAARGGHIIWRILMPRTRKSRLLPSERLGRRGCSLACMERDR
jgi:hypothetical protein